MSVLGRSGTVGGEAFAEDLELALDVAEGDGGGAGGLEGGMLVLWGKVWGWGSETHVSGQARELGHVDLVDVSACLWRWSGWWSEVCVGWIEG